MAKPIVRPLEIALGPVLLVMNEHQQTIAEKTKTWWTAYLVPKTNDVTTTRGLMLANNAASAEEAEATARKAIAELAKQLAKKA